MTEPIIEEKYKKFAIAYTSGRTAKNIKESALAAGYSEKYSAKQGYKILKRKEVQEYIKYLNEERKKQKPDEKLIADINAIQAFWTQIMNNPKEKTGDRIRASENLAKVQGAYNNEWA